MLFIQTCIGGHLVCFLYRFACHMIYYILCEFHRVYKNVKRSTVEIPVLPLYVFCVLRQGTLCIFVLVHIDRIGYRLRLEVNQRWPGVPSRGSLWYLSNNTTETRNIKTTFIGRRIKKIANTSKKIIILFTEY